MLRVNTCDVKGAEAELSRGIKLQDKPGRASASLGSSGGNITLRHLLCHRRSDAGYPRKGVAWPRQLSAAEKALRAGSCLLTALPVASWVASPSFRGIWVVHFCIFQRQQSHLPLEARHNHAINIVNSLCICSSDGMWKLDFPIP